MSWVEAIAGRRIAVIGDLMLDSYLSGEVTRISPEAPVPVMRVLDERAVPGAAANVAMNLASLKIRVRLVGVVGEDEAGKDLCGILDRSEGIDGSGVVRAPDRRTIRKLRIIGARQQIVRVDQEDTTPFARDIEMALMEAAIAAIASADLVIISDYGKGVCSDAVLETIFAHARTLGVSVIVDPKRRDLACYRGAALITPNRKELTEATLLPCETDEQAKQAARSAHEQSGADVLLTRSEKGMSFFPAAGDPIHLGVVAQDVFDVSGAGDTVVAVIGAAQAAKLPFVEAMRLANHAAGIVVSKLGTSTVSIDELTASLALEAIDVGGDGGLLSWDEAVARRQGWAHAKLTVGFANGCFDLLHPGHVSLIRQAARACDRLIVALNSDESVQRLKGLSRPIQDQAARAEVMAAIKGVAAVVLFDEDTPRALIEALQPDLLVKGSDYTVDRVVGADIVIGRGGRVLLADLEDGHSTSRLAERARR